MNHPLELMVRRLNANGALSADDKAAILALPHTLRSVPPSTYLLREGEAALFCPVLVTGMAYRHKIAVNGARQIVALHVAGEPLDLQSLYLEIVDHNVQTLTQSDLAYIPMGALRELVALRPAIAAAVMRNLLVEASILREWVLNVGRRPARERLAHLLCEYAWRLHDQGLAGPDHYELKMTQEQMGDALGLTAVHVNRSLRGLEQDGLIQRNGRVVSFPNIRELRKVADFSELYLHPTR